MVAISNNTIPKRELWTCGLGLVLARTCFICAQCSTEMATSSKAELNMIFSSDEDNVV